MPPSCPMTSGGFRGPPVPLLVVPVVIQLVRLSRDPKMTTYLSHISKGGPMAIAENAHKLAQYALSKVPSDVLYWLTSKVLNLPPGTAMQTTEFLKSRSDLEILMGEDPSICHDEQGSRTAALIPSDIERRLEKLELEYQVLQEKHNSLLTQISAEAIPKHVNTRDQMKPLNFLVAAYDIVTTKPLKQATILTTSATNTTRLIPILVGGSALTFTPNSVVAQPGDVLQFQFGARNHTVTQSAQQSPCQPLANANANAGGGVNSGFIPFDGGASGAVGTFDVPVMNNQPMWLYCAQATHCQSGMVMAINA
ncbi:hypothetical protein N0V82_009581 [Gnomoniopsis sp. IMI 355080]|nr:hypothetical protein N0V82_009581 [Gnomoniopsis sp. IMI 355080]